MSDGPCIIGRELVGGPSGDLGLAGDRSDARSAKQVRRQRLHFNFREKIGEAARRGTKTQSRLPR